MRGPAQEISPATFRGARFTTNSACRPSISFGYGRYFFMPTRMERAWSPKSTRSRTSFSERATSSTARMVPTRTSILSRSEVEMRGLMGAGFMFHSLLRLGRSRRTRSHPSANRVHRDWSWRDEAWSRRGWESRDCRAPTASSGRPG